jgi:hypothetical protein
MRDEGPIPAMKFCELTLPEKCCQQYIVAGVFFSLSTNSEAVHAAMSESFGRAAKLVPAPEVTMHVVVGADAQDARRWPKPYFRGLNHFVFAGFDSESQLLIDLRRQRIIGRLSQLMAGDRDYLRRVVFPALFGIVSQTIRITALHCACVAWNGSGLLLAGDSGSGKSTLSLALAQEGLDFISDDWTYLSRHGGSVHAWSLNNSLKLLPDAVVQFPELARLRPAVSLNGELAYELEPDRLFGIRSSRYTEPRCVMFLERQPGQTMELNEVSPAEAADRLEQSLEELPAAICGARDFLVDTIRILTERPCWELRYGAETPRAIAGKLLRFLNANVWFSRG